MNTDSLIITTSPHIHHRDTTASIMWRVSAALAPAALWGVYQFGLSSLTVLLVSIASCLLFEYFAGRATGRFTLNDGSAFLTGLLVGMNMPGTIPLYIPVIASAFAILVVKWTFGGLGRNWMNPALAGRVFVFFSWTGDMTTWPVPRALRLDAVTMSTPLSSIKTGLLELTEPVSGPMALLRDLGFPVSDLDMNLTASFRGIFPGLENGYFDLFLGNIPGCIGEASALLLLAGGIYLMLVKIVNWEIVASYAASFVVLIFLFAGIPFGSGLFAGDVLFHILSGGFMLGLLFMATDMVSSPLTKKGMLIYGAGIGFLTFLIRIFGSFPEGVSLAIILMNIFVPMINRYTQPKLFGEVRQEAAK
ncbi:RnfABCDGE type electron transport complex subunit D [Marispirochaeta aestuarii]|uniref:RnfABCDGE type electron transport complex subunit D n=1 Tax=Marispirochaeta aestuarii TaxID=1963862 RepID=UPI0029C6EEB0|nr:RnfABCDGE type electron transport complex subunit D [Marispirochaeta aestuarii]